jgi:hypothetical protein
MRYPKLLLNPLLSITLLLLLTASCIDESHIGCVQYAIATQLVDTKGNPMGESVSEPTLAYLFLNDKFDHVVTSESDGRYLISFDENSKASLVVFGNMNTDSFRICTPNVGDDISETSVNLIPKTRVSELQDIYTAHLYYGRYDYTADSAGSTKVVLLPLLDRQVKLHVVVQGLRETYGEGDYKIVLEGLHNAVAFDGTVIGDSVSYHPTASFANNGDLVSETLRTLPTKTGEAVMLSIYKGDSELWHSSLDSDGKQITLAGGEDKVVVINVARREFSMVVEPWSDYLNQNTSF